MNYMDRKMKDIKTYVLREKCEKKDENQKYVNNSQKITKDEMAWIYIKITR